MALFNPKKVYLKSVLLKLSRWSNSGGSLQMDCKLKAKCTAETQSHIFYDFQFFLHLYSFCTLSFWYTFFSWLLSFHGNFSASSSMNHFSFYTSFLFSTKQISRRKMSLSKLLTQLQRKTNEKAINQLIAFGVLQLDSFLHHWALPAGDKTF